MAIQELHELGFAFKFLFLKLLQGLFLGGGTERLGLQLFYLLAVNDVVFP